MEDNRATPVEIILLDEDDVPIDDKKNETSKLRKCGENIGIYVDDGERYEKEVINVDSESFDLSSTRSNFKESDDEIDQGEKVEFRIGKKKSVNYKEYNDENNQYYTIEFMIREEMNIYKEYNDEADQGDAVQFRIGEKNSINKEYYDEINRGDEIEFRVGEKKSVNKEFDDQIDRGVNKEYDDPEAKGAVEFDSFPESNNENVEKHVDEDVGGRGGN